MGCIGLQTPLGLNAEDSVDAFQHRLEASNISRIAGVDHIDIESVDGSTL